MTNAEDTIGVGIIGAGARGVPDLGNRMVELHETTGLRINGVYDRLSKRSNEACAYLKDAYKQQGVDHVPQVYEDYESLIASDDIDLIIVTSVTDSHSEHAVAALKSGKKVYCDKPLAENARNAARIVETEKSYQNPLIMGFTRRYETVWRKAHEFLRNGEIGELRMILIRSVLPYWHYLTGWWRRREWSGDALNDKGAHLFDVFNWFTGGEPIRVSGMGGLPTVTPDPSAPRRCTECNRDCEFRRRAEADDSQDTMSHIGASWLEDNEEKYRDDICIYSDDNDIYQNATVQFQYDSGISAQYFYTIFGPRAEDQETMELVGTNGRMILNRHTGTIDLFRRHPEHQEIVDCRTADFNEKHFGADDELIRELGRFARGAQPLVPAVAGLQATRMVEGALVSLDKGGVSVEMADIAGASVQPET